MAFFYIVIISEFVLRLVFQVFFVSNDDSTMWQRNQILKAITGFFYAGWCIFVFSSFDSFTQHCYDPFPSFSLAVFGIIVCFILPLAFLTMFFTFIFILFSPCLIFSVYTMMQERNAAENTRQSVI